MCIYICIYIYIYICISIFYIYIYIFECNRNLTGKQWHTALKKRKADTQISTRIRHYEVVHESTS